MIQASLHTIDPLELDRRSGLLPVLYHLNICRCLHIPLYHPYRYLPDLPTRNGLTIEKILAKILYLESVCSDCFCYTFPNAFDITKAMNILAITPMILCNDSYTSSGSRTAKFILIVAQKVVSVQVNNNFVYDRLKQLADDTAQAGELMFGMIARTRSLNKAFS